MALDQQTIETLVEVIAREVLTAIEEQRLRVENPNGNYCKAECSGGLCVQTCFNQVGQVINAGAERLTSTLGVVPDNQNLAPLIDHTLLKPDATPDQVAQLCAEARKYNFASVCVNPTWVPMCARLLKGSPVKVTSVIGFPLGATTTEVKAFETEDAIHNGANEIDMVINIGALKARDLETVARDIRAVVEVSHRHGALVKVIIEAALLTDEEKVISSLLAKEAGADYVKTSTGFAGGGATVEDVALMRRTVGPEIGVKAAGGVRTREDAEKMVQAGATRIGASAGIKIVKGDKESGAKAPAPSGSKLY